MNVEQLLSLEGLGKVLVPAAAFLGGIAVTLATKHLEKRRLAAKENITAVVTLVNEWYNQVHQLSVDAAHSADSKDTARGVYFYVHNRLIMPKLVLHLGYLRHRWPRSELVAAVDDFLALVTTEPLAPNPAAKESLQMTCKDLFSPELGNKEPPQAKVWLVQLDKKLQDITRLSAAALAKAA